jgi:hypothetical protein
VILGGSLEVVTKLRDYADGIKEDVSFDFQRAFCYNTQSNFNVSGQIEQSRENCLFQCQPSVRSRRGRRIKGLAISTKDPPMM